MDVFVALDDPLRRELLRQLAGGAARVVDLAAGHPVSRPAVSRHLRILREAGLVQVTDRGRERHYALDTDPLADVRALLDELQPAARPPITGRHLDALDTEAHRAARDRRTATPTTDRRTPTTREHTA